MIKYISLLFTFLTIIVNAQNQRFTYQYYFAGDKSNLDDFYTEMMALDITEEGSEFYSVDKIKADSISRVERQKQRRSGNFKISEPDDRSKVDFSVNKSYPAYDVVLTTNLGRDSYIVKDPRSLDWKIQPESKMIGEWKTQKAITEFAGREWTAWFTMDIPIPDGPYKFRGLPGMIVEVSSKDKTHNFKLVSVRNLNLMDQLSDSKPSYGRGRRQPLEVNAKQFLKQQEKYYQDPTAEFRSRFSGGRSFRFQLKGPDGSPMTTKDLEKVILERVEKEKQEKSNPLELDMVN